MTFNIRYGGAQDGENHWQYRKDIVKEIIQDYNPDILAVQEALNFQLLELDRALPNYARIGVGRDDGEINGEYAAIYYDTARFDMLAEETFWFSDTPSVPGSKSWGNTIPRICSWVRLDDLETGEDLYVYNNHWDHQSQPSRERCAEYLLETIKSHYEPATTVVVLGDFNAGENNPAFLQLMNSDEVPLVDSYRRLHPQAKNVGTFHGFEGKTTGSKIDAILISPGLISRSAEIIRMNRDGRYPSDHFPVTAEVTFQ